MPKKTSPLWDYFEDEVVICQVGNCKQRISRGKTGTERSRLSNTGMRTHLMTSHGKEWQEFLKKDQNQNAAKAEEKEKVLEEMLGNVQLLLPPPLTVCIS